MTAIAVVVVTHNSEAEIGPCLDALGGTETLVVDNASGDSTVRAAREYSAVRIIANPDNRGFAAAVNQGVRAAKGNLVLLLNPDAVLLSGLSELAAACERDGIAAGKLVDTDGRAQSGFTIRRFPTPSALCFEALGLNRLLPGNPVNRNYRYLDRDLDQPGPVEQPAGAFLMFRRDVFERIGGFDESFFPVWFEDVDFLKRARDGGYFAQYVPVAVARHAGAHSVARLPRECRTLYWYVSLLRYAHKHFRTIEFRFVCGGVAAGCLLRSVTGMFGERNAIAVHGQVVRLALTSLLAGRLQCGGTSVKKGSGLDEEAGNPVASHPVQR